VPRRFVHPRLNPEPKKSTLEAGLISVSSLLSMVTARPLARMGAYVHFPSAYHDHSVYVYNHHFIHKCYPLLPDTHTVTK